MVDMCTLWGHETVFIDIGVRYGKEYLWEMHSVGVAFI